MKEAGPGRSMANCVTQRKPGPACSQPLRRGFKAFQGKVELSPVSEWTLPETENGFKTKRLQECDYWISQRVNCVGKHAAERVHWSFSETDTVSAESAEFQLNNWQKNETVKPSSALAPLGYGN